ncbi:MAG: protein-L-isoaspartate(D-aspartate) O-methyltransferase [Candidatus Marinimicrobia bacterium]|nr:protein-L-isoaspartate(D-aspartate) O-methyltransferase [Candidatus Neomarinimicrobiota bacterium]
MIRDQLKSRGIRDDAVLRVMKSVERHKFVPEEYKDRAYDDGPLPIGHGQTISQPYIVAYMTEQLQVSKDHKVLEIGTGSGYQAAVLGELADQVFTIEIVPELAEGARQILKDLKYGNIAVRTGDGYKGWPEEAPFDRVIVTAAPKEIPQALVDQLTNGGRMIIPVGKQFFTQYLWVIEKDKKGVVSKEKILPVRFVPMVKE